MLDLYFLSIVLSCGCTSVCVTASINTVCSVSIDINKTSIDIFNISDRKLNKSIKNIFLLAKSKIFVTYHSGSDPNNLAA
uniref:Putative secreted protein n=1 Tax=Panstrongylus lignarius TaxID=156445 RepID=A0A224Y584_9HEMI